MLHLVISASFLLVSLIVMVFKLYDRYPTRRLLDVKYYNNLINDRRERDRTRYKWGLGIGVVAAMYTAFFAPVIFVGYVAYFCLLYSVHLTSEIEFSGCYNENISQEIDRVFKDNIYTPRASSKKDHLTLL